VILTHGQLEGMAYGRGRGTAADTNDGARSSRGMRRLGEQGKGGLEDRTIGWWLVQSAWSGREGRRQQPPGGQVVAVIGGPDTGEVGPASKGTQPGNGGGQPMGLRRRCRKRRGPGFTAARAQRASKADAGLGREGFDGWDRGTRERGIATGWTTRHELQ
jgi:hypothetical protein